MMTCREKLKQEHPECIKSFCFGGCLWCPKDYGYKVESLCWSNSNGALREKCTACWDQELEDVEQEDK